MRLFHGSEQVIRQPSLAAARPHNDYGPGFYCTDAPDRAGEWACKNRTDGFINEYKLNLDGLAILDLLDGNYTVLHWIALLLKNRTFDLQEPSAREAREFLINNYAPDLTNVDIVIGYRADDSYFAYAQAFVQNSLPLRLLEQALHLGKLGEQIVLVSDHAFEHLQFTDARFVNATEYYPKFRQRDSAARWAYRELVGSGHSLVEDRFVFDIIREGGVGDDARIRRNLP